ncbi:MAG: c-type cytochrome [Pseudomonadota bacterium]
MNKSISVFVMSVLFAGLVANATAQSAETGMSERERIMAEIEKDIHNKQSLNEAISRGKDRSVLCGHCHGVDGNSVKPDIPNLAGQNPAYIIEQIGKFIDGTRKNFVMQTLASGFTFQDKVNLAVYFTSQQLKPVEANSTLASKGEGIYKSVCFRCHGADGRGEEGYSRLSGQQIDYVQMTLKRFRAAANSNDHSEDKRRNASMEQVTARLSDEQIEGLAHYIALLK